MAKCDEYEFKIEMNRENVLAMDKMIQDKSQEIHKLKNSHNP